MFLSCAAVNTTVDSCGQWVLVGSMRRIILFAFLTTLAALTFYIMIAPVPTYRAERLFYKFIMTPIQRIALDTKDQFDTNRPFAYEKPEALRDLRKAYKLDRFVDTKSDLNTAVNLMHWVRNQFPHGEPKHQPDPQSFDGLKLLQNLDPKGYFCGTAAQLFIQAYTSIGGSARRVQLRFTPGDQHSVAEAWIRELNKWVVFDPDYDIYYTVDNVPQNALELHSLWVNNDYARILVSEYLDSPNNIYNKGSEKLDSTLMRRVFEERNWTLWDKTIKKRDLNYYHNARFSVKLLNYYSFIFYPMRNDWKSRPLPWWHPEANRFQGSLVIQLPTMPVYEDFLWVTTDQHMFANIHPNTH